LCVYLLSVLSIQSKRFDLYYGFIFSPCAPVSPVVKCF